MVYVDIRKGKGGQKDFAFSFHRDAELCTFPHEVFLWYQPKHVQHGSLLQNALYLANGRLEYSYLKNASFETANGWKISSWNADVNISIERIYIQQLLFHQKIILHRTSIRMYHVEKNIHYLNFTSPSKEG